MAIRTKDDLLNSLKAKFGDDTSDDVLSIIEDVTDTIADYETRTADTTDWKQKFEDNDKMWRTKYRDRFFNKDNDNSNNNDNDNDSDNETEEPTNFDELFK